MRNRLLQSSIRFYQIVLSPWFGGSCRFYPSCSQYTKKALGSYQWWRALLLSFRRVVKCHPFHPGGIDLP